MFCEYVVATDDQQLWMMILNNLLDSYEKKTFSFIRYPQLASAAHYLNRKLVTYNGQFNNQDLPFLFLFIPRYILNNYYDIFQEELIKTKNFNRSFYSVSCKNADKYSNWLLAGMHYYLRDCNEPENLQSLITLLQSLPNAFPAFHALTKEDCTTFVSMIQMVPNSGKTILSLLVDPALREVMIQLVVVSPVLMAKKYMEILLAQYPKESESIIKTILVKMFEMDMMVHFLKEILYRLICRYFSDQGTAIQT